VVEDTASSAVAPLEVVMRVVVAAALLAGGLVHLDLYFRYGYRDFPDANLGRSFLANGIASVVVAAVVLLRRDAIVRLAGIAISAGTLIAFFLSRNTDQGIFGFTEKGFVPSPQAAIAFIAEIVALVILVASFVPALRWRHQAVVNMAVGGALALIVVALGIAAPVVWANDSTATSSPNTTYPSATTTVVPGAPATTTATGDTDAAPDASTAAVTIKGFAFDPQAATVTVGETITWTNEDGTDHTVSAADGSFDSGDLGQGATFSQTFSAAGTFDYVCDIHPGMKASVTVTG
jgi:plastocyanin